MYSRLGWGGQGDRGEAGRLRAPHVLAAAAVVAALVGAQAATGGPPLPVGGGHACNVNDPPSCAYTSNLSYEVGVVDGIELEDSTRNGYRVPVLVRYPIGADGPRPTVIWHHGGNPGENGKNGSDQWGNLLAEAGYVVIHHSRVFPDSLTSQELDACQDSGFYDPDDPLDDGSECEYWLGNYRYGPMNTRFILSELTEIERADPALTGIFDAQKIVIAGFSAGTTGVHVNAGAWQQWTTDSEKYRDRIHEAVAFFAAGPQGPEYAGFGSGFQSKDGDAGWDVHSWAEIERPFMFVTGIGDETNEPPESRVAAFLSSVGNGNKYMLWNTEPDAGHGTMNLERCDSEVEAAHCEWIGSAGLAYFDAVVRDRHQAQKWLASGSLEILSSGAIELYRR